MSKTLFIPKQQTVNRYTRAGNNGKVIICPLCNTEDGLYPIEGITKQMILDASWLYLQMCAYPSQPEYSWGDGDSLDREHVRDNILNVQSFLGGN